MEFQRWKETTSPSYVISPTTPQVQDKKQKQMPRKRFRYISRHCKLIQCYLITALLRCNLHTINRTHLKCTMQCILVYSQNCTPVTIIFEHFHHPKETPSPSAIPPPFLPPSPPSALSKHWSTVSTHLPILDISWKWNHAIPSPCVWLPCCSMYFFQWLNNIPLYATSHGVCLFISWWKFGFFPLFGFYDSLS